MSCGTWAWVHSDKGIYRFLCGSGNCGRPECKKLFWSRRIRLISALIEQYDLTRFFTLTLDPAFTVSDPWAYIHHPWSKLRHRIKRRHPGWRFVAILERHQDRDVPHIHGFTDIWMPQAEWSRLWNECYGGEVVWIERVSDNVTAGEYVSKTLEVAKYVGKGNIKASYKVGESGEKKRVRTLWRSKHTKADYELTSSGEWSILKEDIFNEQGEMTNYGKRVEGRFNGGKTEQVRQDLETA